MSSPDGIRRAWLSVAALIGCSSAIANPIVVGLGIEGDDADSRSLSVFGDIGLTEDTWISGAFAVTETDRDLLDVSNKFAEVSIDHHFKPFGLRVGGAYWGDDGLLESIDFRGALYLRGDPGSLSLDYQRRNFDLTVGGLVLDSRTVGFSANGIGLSLSAALGERWRVYGGGMGYDYSRDIRLQPNVDTLRILGLTRLSLINGLVDYRASAGLEYTFGERSIDVRYARWRTEVDQSEINSFGVGLSHAQSAVPPISKLRLAYDDSEDFGGATVLSLFLYLYDE